LIFKAKSNVFITGSTNMISYAEGTLPDGKVLNEIQYRSPAKYLHALAFFSHQPSTVTVKKISAFKSKKGFPGYTQIPRLLDEAAGQIAGVVDK
jgi:hypothetical protein